MNKSSSNSITDLDKILKNGFNFQLHNINDLVTEFNGFMPPNRISHCVLAIITNGTGTKTIGNHSFNICKNMAMIIPKRVIHSTNTWSLDTDGYMLSFNDLIFEEYHFPLSFLPIVNLFKYSKVPYKVFDDSTSEKVQRIFEDLFHLQKTASYKNKKLFILKLSELIICYDNAFGENLVVEKQHFLYDNFLNLIELNYRQSLEVKFYANLLQIHPNYLNTIVRSFSNLSAKQIIIKRVIHEAKYLLATTIIPIKEIAFELGFTDYNYFCRLFKKYCMLTPKLYRQKNS